MKKKSRPPIEVQRRSEQVSATQALPSARRVLVGETSEATVERFQGPIPPPDILRGYDQALPGAAERILSMAERESAHRHRVTESSIDYQYSEKRRGQIFAFIITVFSLLLAVLTAKYVSVTLGSIIGGTTVVGLAGVFIAAKHAKAPEE